MQLPDETVQEILDDMHAKGVAAGKAKAKAAALRVQLKITEATLTDMALTISAATNRPAARSWALQHPTYKEVADAMVAAIEEAAITSSAHNRAEKEWESWRSLNANDRGIR